MITTFQTEEEKIPTTGYILVWEIDEYKEMGGGLGWDRVEHKEDGLKTINQLNKEWEEKFELLHFSWYSHIVEIEPINIVTEFKIK